MKFQIVTDINSLFRKDKEYGIKNILVLINNYGKDFKAFKLPRNFQVSGTNVNDRRKILKVLCDYGFMNRKRDENGEVCQNERTGIFFKKRYYRYTLVKKFEEILRDLVKSLLHSNWINVKANNGIQEVKQLIKNIYINTKFNVDKFGNHIFTLKGKRLSLCKYNNGIVHIKQGNEIWEWVAFYNLYIKKSDGI